MPPLDVMEPSLSFWAAMRQLPALEDEECAGRDQNEADRMIPGQRLLQVQHRKTREDGQGDDFLHRLQFSGRIDRVADAVGRDRQAILDKGDPPACQDRERERRGLELEMPVSGEGHENVGKRQQDDWRDGGRDGHGGDGLAPQGGAAEPSPGP